MLSKENLIAALAVRVEDVSVSGLADGLLIKIMSGYERDEFQKILQEKGITDSAYFSALIAATVVGEDDQPMFSSDEIDLLRGSHAELVREIGLACQRVNGMGRKAVDDAEKN